MMTYHISLENDRQKQNFFDSTKQIILPAITERGFYLNYFSWQSHFLSKLRRKSRENWRWILFPLRDSLASPQQSRGIFPAVVGFAFAPLSISFPFILFPYLSFPFTAVPFISLHFICENMFLSHSFQQPIKWRTKRICSQQVHLAGLWTASRACSVKRKIQQRQTKDLWACWSTIRSR